MKTFGELHKGDRFRFAAQGPSGPEFVRAGRDRYHFGDNPGQSYIGRDAEPVLVEGEAVDGRYAVTVVLDGKPKVDARFVLSRDDVQEYAEELVRHAVGLSLAYKSHTGDPVRFTLVPNLEEPPCTS